MTSNPLGTALITGASTGLGAVYADRLARRGYGLIMVARDGAKMEAIAQRLRAETGRAVDVLPADLTDAGDVARVAGLFETDASITMLVNNAGMSLNGGLLDSDPAALQQLIALNVTAPTLLAAAAGRAFVARQGGAIVNIASVLALAPERFDGVYSGSKAYILNLTLSLAGTVKGTGVRVQAVLPGATRTEIWARSGKDIDAFPPAMVMEASDLVDAALIGLDKGETVTIPPLADERQWIDYTESRLVMGPNLSRRAVAERYRPATDRTV